MPEDGTLLGPFAFLIGQLRIAQNFARDGQPIICVACAVRQNRRKWHDRAHSARYAGCFFGQKNLKKTAPKVSFRRRVILKHY
jgi:hypothetical protein